jgi:hypothetical protein
MDGLRCLNCPRTVPTNEAKVFAGVFVCPTCHDTAERLYRRSEGELRMLLLMLKESIRIALVEGRLHVGERSVEEVSKTDLLRMMVRLEEQRTARTPSSR